MPSARLDIGRYAYIRRSSDLEQIEEADLVSAAARSRHPAWRTVLSASASSASAIVYSYR
jgi:hypothetical protein